jgi:hypothetical protein
MAWLHRLTPAATVLASCLAAACNQEPQQPRERPAQAADATDSPRLGFSSQGGLELVETAQDGRVLAGHRRPVPPQSSARLVYDPVLFDAQGQKVPLPALGGLQDARFAPPPSLRMALLDAQDRLWLWDGSSPGAEQLDDNVFPGFGFSHAADVLMYSKGAAPELDVWRYELLSAQRVQLTDKQEPVWGFAFSPDDTRVVFVGSQGGFPSLYTMGVDGTALARLTHRGLRSGEQLQPQVLAPVPDGRTPPVWGPNAVYVENAEGVHAIDFQGSVLWSAQGASELHRGRAPGSILMREAGRYRSVR